MEYKLSEVLDLENFRNLMENFYKITKIPYGLLDLKANVILGIGWQDICVNFHIKHETSLKVCREGNYEGFKNCKQGEYYIHVCKMG